MRLVLTLISVTVLVSGQTSTQTAERFEVASLKPSKPGTRMRSITNPAQITCTGHTLLALIRTAYPDIAVEPWRVSGGPSWLDSETWDLVANFPPNMPRDEASLYNRAEAMLRVFLSEEFHLMTHHETRKYPVYSLEVAKRGPKLKTSVAGEFDVKRGSGRLEFHYQTMDGLVRFLYYPGSATLAAADRPVIDKTGLRGVYDFTLEWTPETLATDAGPAIGTVGPSIYTAIEQQLGLKLRPTRASVDFLAIDSVQRPAAK